MAKPADISAYPTERISGAVPAALGNAVSDAIIAALHQGLTPDQAACITVTVAADYARETYGNDYLLALANVVILRGNEPLPGGTQ